MGKDAANERLVLACARAWKESLDPHYDTPGGEILRAATRKNFELALELSGATEADVLAKLEH